MNLLRIILLLSFGIVFQNSGFAKSRNNEKKIELDIVYIGNSITHGANLLNPMKDAPPVIASEYLRKKPEIGSVLYSNQGRSGYTTVDYLPESETFQEVVQATRQINTNTTHQLIFTIMLGTNDSAIQGPKGSPVSKEDYYKNMKAIIDRLLMIFPESKIVLQQPIWYSDNTYNGAKYLAEGLVRLQSYFPELKALVKAYSKSNQNRVYQGDQLGFDYFKKNYLTDLVPENGNQGKFYLHPNEKGAAKLAEFWAESIYKVVK